MVSLGKYNLEVINHINIFENITKARVKDCFIDGNNKFVFIVNKEEAKIILGHEEGDEISVKRLLKGIVDLGPKMVIITDGGEGSYGYNEESFYHLDIFPAKLVEMTGAGDAYATGVLAGLFHGKDLKEAMRWGAANGASVVEQVGPQAGLLTFHGMQEKLKENTKIVAKEI